MILKDLCANMEKELLNLFPSDNEMPQREDSRAFGAMIEKKIKDSWPIICQKLEMTQSTTPGRRTIYDFAANKDENFYGFDIKTKDLNPKRYSDGGICSVSNLLKFLANENGNFIIIEFGHHSSDDNSKTTYKYIKVAPFHQLPKDSYRIENLGTGQLRLNHRVDEIYDQIAWNRTRYDFFDFFAEEIIKHYENVKANAELRINSIKEFKNSGYTQYKG